MRNRLRERREQLHYSQEELAELVGVSELTVRRWEAGQRPQPLHLRQLCETLEAAPGELGFGASDDEPLREAAEVAALAGASEAGEGVLEITAEAVDRLRRAYSRTPPEALLRALQERLRVVRRLLEGQLRVGQRRELLDAAGWLSLELGTVYFDLDRSEPAHAWRDVALTLSQEAGDDELRAWSWETPSWFAFAEQRFADSVELAERGLGVAPGSSVEVALYLQQARAWARLRDTSAALEGIRRAARALEGLTEPKHLDDHYVFDPAKADFFIAGAYALLDLAKPAEHHAREFIRQAGQLGSQNYWPVRVSSARMELGFALLQQGRLDEAAAEAAEGFQAPMIHRGTLRRARELDAALAVHGDIEEVRDFHERLEVAGSKVAG
ncbi:helix-turn-helix domain-containing protein [Candidatus Nephthysia bennettiae]|uniref:Helix-turn-helix domain-containing protein n=1 Tax=Candidatus Nephthysia bennettiae TaxID=3127016 RepID=A0A934N8M2_9BACT|nr:helix-turn-helix domain-containing protein [Candidatus Dormibacteraeota bacterium]